MAYVPNSWVPNSITTVQAYLVRDPVEIKKDALRKKFKKAAKKAELFNAASTALEISAQEHAEKRRLKKKLQGAANKVKIMTQMKGEGQKRKKRREAREEGGLP